MGLSLPDEGGGNSVGEEGIRAAMGSPRIQGQASGPTLMESQQTVGKVLTKMGFGVDGGGGGGHSGGTLAGHATQMEGDERCQLSRCVCSTVENTEPQLWESWPDLIIPSSLK